MQLVQMIDHDVPSLAGEPVRGVTLACPATFCGIIQTANEYCLVFLLVFLPTSTVFVRLQFFTYCAPVVVASVFRPSRLGRPAEVVSGKVVGNRLRSPKLGV